MNLKAIRIVFYIFAVTSIVLAIGDKYYGWHVFGYLIFTGVIMGMAASLLLSHKISNSRNIRLGSESLPPKKDIASVRVSEVPLPGHIKDKLVNALIRARRARTTYPVVHEIPFKILDKYDGVWELVAYLDKNGDSGFSMNRVFYAGSAAEKVAKYVGIK